jgi:hypothetical protein
VRVNTSPCTTAVSSSPGTANSACGRYTWVTPETLRTGTDNPRNAPQTLSGFGPDGDAESPVRNRFSTLYF